MPERFLKNANIPEHPVCCVIVSPLKPEIIGELKKLGIRACCCPELKNVAGTERLHADMCLYHMGENELFCSGDVIGECETFFSGEGLLLHKTLQPVTAQKPGLNVCALGNRIIYDPKCIDESLFGQLLTRGFFMIPTKQRYTRCSMAVVSENAVMTSDPGLYTLCRNNHIDVLRIRPGGIELEGYEYGFIGGCCSLLAPDILAFSGSVEKHPDFPDIRSFCRCHKVFPVSLSDNNLYDIGGIIQLKETVST